MADEKPNLTGFGRRLRELREAKGWSQRQLGEAAGGVKQQAIAKYELEANTPTWVMVLKLARALGVQPNDFLEENPNEK